MRQSHRRRAALRRESRALHWSRLHRHAWAIQEANEAVALRRSVADQYPVEMARALAVRAACLYARGRIAEAARDIDECQEFRDRSNLSAHAAQLAAIASLLDHAGRPEEGWTLAEQLVSGAFPPSREPVSTLVYCEFLVRRGRAEEAVDLLRELDAGRTGLRMRTSVLLFEALAAAGRRRELEEHARRDLWLFALNAWGNVPGRQTYIHLLALLEQHHVVGKGLPPFAWAIARQHRKLLRQQRRRWLLVVAVAVLTGHLREVPDRPRAAGPPDPNREAARARVSRAEADIERYSRSDDVGALSQAWGVLALARWQAGGQRSAALQAQRTAVAQTRRWAVQDPDKARPVLVMRLRLLAEFSAVVGLRTDAQLAQEEADDLDRVM